MIKIPNTLKRVLEVSSIYWAFQSMVGAHGAHTEILTKYAKPKDGEAVLDVGCGPAKIRAMLPDVHYVGADFDQTYLDAARKEFGDTCDFELCGADEIASLDSGPFDLILGVGLVHHLDDETADAFLAGASSQLAPGGRLVTMDGCFHPGESRFGRMMVANDRGEYLRPSDAYAELAKPHFESVDLDVRFDLLRIPYSHAVMVLRNEAEANGSR